MGQLLELHFHWKSRICLMLSEQGGQRKVEADGSDACRSWAGKMGRVLFTSEMSGTC